MPGVAGLRIMTFPALSKMVSNPKERPTPIIYSVNHNFETDPILPRIDGEWVSATETTLGADNGIGISSILAILESKEIQHGPIEALFTNDEETGMYGAIGLEPGELQGEILLNTD